MVLLHAHQLVGISPPASRNIANINLEHRDILHGGLAEYNSDLKFAESRIEPGKGS